MEAVDDVMKDTIKQNTADYKSAVKEDLLQLEIRLKDKLSDQFKWVIGIFVTLALMIIGLYISK